MWNARKGKRMFTEPKFVFGFIAGALVALAIKEIGEFIEYCIGERRRRRRGTPS